jgi:hypothetical protein
MIALSRRCIRCCVIFASAYLQRMSMLYLRCPKTNRPFATNLNVDAEDKPHMPRELRFTACPHCKTDHAWYPDDAFFDFQGGPVRP